MKTTLPRIVVLGLFASLQGVLAGPPEDDTSVLTAVFAKTASDYQRRVGPDGQRAREYYALTNGGPEEGTIRDNAQEKVPFVSIATVLAQHLAGQGYFPATDPTKVDLLIVVKWGKTLPFTDDTYRDGVDNVLNSMNRFSVKSQVADAARAAASGQSVTSVNLTGTVESMEADAAQNTLQSDLILQDMTNRSRLQSAARNARLLGYMGNINESDGIQRFAGGGGTYDRLIADIEDARYYIILSAYDFQQTVRNHRPKLQWVTRMSMQARGNSFAEKAAGLIAYSASRFGRNSQGLEQKLYPQYKVNLEDTRFLGEAARSPAKAEPAKADGR